MASRGLGQDRAAQRHRSRGWRPWVQPSPKDRGTRWDSRVSPPTCQAPTMRAIAACLIAVPARVMKPAAASGGDLMSERLWPLTG